MLGQLLKKNTSDFTKNQPARLERHNSKGKKGIDAMRHSITMNITKESGFSKQSSNYLGRAITPSKKRTEVNDILELSDLQVDTEDNA